MIAYTRHERDCIDDYGYLPADEADPIDPELLALAETPEGMEMEPRAHWQDVEDERAKAAADLAWANRRRAA